MSGGKLGNRLRFERPAEVSNGAGGRVSGYEPAFTVWAEFIRRRSGEAVIAGRQAGKRPTIIRIHYHTAAAEITSSWQALDTHTGERFDIHSAIRSDDRQWLEIDATGYRK